MKIRVLFVVCLLAVSVSCSDEQHPVDGDHVWKDQTDMIDKAKQVEQLVNDSALQQKQDIEQSTD